MPDVQRRAIFFFPRRLIWSTNIINFAPKHRHLFSYMKKQIKNQTDHCKFNFAKSWFPKYRLHQIKVIGDIPPVEIKLHMFQLNLLHKNSHNLTFVIIGNRSTRHQLFTALLTSLFNLNRRNIPSQSIF